MSSSRSTTIINQAFQSQNTGGRSQKQQTLYDILEASPTATLAEIKAAYFKLAKIHHPDKGGNGEQFKKIEHAYSVLSNAAKRKSYDNVMNDPAEEKQYCQTSFEDFFKKLVNILDASFDSFINMAKKEENKQSYITPWEYPVNTSWGTAKMLATAKKDMVLFAVGKPIQISKKASKFRDNIREAELISSFPNDTNIILLFADEMDARNYARATRVGNFYKDTQCLESPVIRVKLLDDLSDNIEVKQLAAFINDYCEDRGHHIAQDNMHYIEINPNRVAPLLISLHVSIVNDFKKYPTINFATKKPMAMKEEKSSCCRIQ